MTNTIRSVILAATLCSAGRILALNEIPDDARIGPFAIGCQAYTFNRATAFEAIERTAAAGGKIIEFFPGQKLSPDSDLKLDHNLSDEGIEKLKAKLKQHNVRAVNYGVVGLPNNEQECRKIFEFAKKLGLYAVTSEPEPAAMDLIEKLVKEYDIAMAIHNHPKQPRNPNYKFWDPEYILSLVKDRDQRLGSCADLGHFARSGVKPVDALKTLEGRVISSHLKDIRPLGPNGHDVPYGTGESDVPEILSELQRQHFKGNISVEYESNVNNNVAEVGQCIGYVRGYVQAQTAHPH
ncbi:MAG TPA: sugar phosphate isomerase/epimerase [Verrucomicrobiae bacterium]|nr:sugar phosphate isomerase/epimerase [Verrucomicrobiae bacterium]